MTEAGGSAIGAKWESTVKNYLSKPNALLPSFPKHYKQASKLYSVSISEYQIKRNISLPKYTSHEIKEGKNSDFTIKLD